MQQSDAELHMVFQRLVFGNTQQEMIRLFQERDPIGKVLYRSLRYVLSKHPGWTKTKTDQNLTILTDSHPNSELADDFYFTSLASLSHKSARLKYPTQLRSTH